MHAVECDTAVRAVPLTVGAAEEVSGLHFVLTEDVVNCAEKKHTFDLFLVV
jgi:hypothetical protein